MEIAAFVLVLLLLIAASGGLARCVRLPLPLFQILIGVALAWPVQDAHIEIEPELFLLIFIPPLLFSDAYSAPKRELFALRKPILDMAIGLVLFTIVGLGSALHWLVPEIPLGVAFALAAVLSPTDAVAVSAMVDRDKVPPRLLHILEGEALLNDASGLVAFRFAVAAAVTGSFSLFEAIGGFIYAGVAGICAGALVLLIAVRSLKWLTLRGNLPAESQVVIALLLPFVAYLVAEFVHASGILAAVTAGLLSGSREFSRLAAPMARIQIASLWSVVGFAFNGATFILLGVQLPAIVSNVPPEINSRLPGIEPALTVLILTLCLIMLRYLWIWVGDFVIHVRRRMDYGNEAPFGARVRLAGAVAGVRGAVTLAGILSLPTILPDGSGFPARDVVIFLAAGVIICSLLLASVALPIIVRDLREPGESAEEEDERRARVSAARAAIEHLETLATEMGGEMELHNAVAENLIALYRRRISSADEHDETHQDIRHLDRVETELRRAAMDAERKKLRAMVRSGEINDVIMRRLSAELGYVEALLDTRSSRK